MNCELKLQLHHHCVYIFQSQFNSSTPIEAVIGPSTDRACELMGAAGGADSFGIPIISYSCTNDVYSRQDSLRYPTFVRTIPPLVKLGHSVIDFVREMGWTHVGMMGLKLEYMVEVKEWASGPPYQIEIGILERAIDATSGPLVTVIGPDSQGAFNQGPERLPYPRRNDAMGRRNCYDDFYYAKLLDSVRSMKKKSRGL